MIFRIVIMFMVAGTPEPFVGVTTYGTLSACNLRLFELAHSGLRGGWTATCVQEVRA